MRQNNIEINVLIKGRPIAEYPHNGQVFIEGRDGSEYEIEIKNHNAGRVEAVISVDGLSVTDGKEAGPQSSGYLIDGNSSVRIPGWKLDSQQVAAFAFAGKGKSYAAQSTGSARNTGVIGVMAFVEKPRPIHQPVMTWNGAPRGIFGSGSGSGYAPMVMHTTSGTMRSMNMAAPVSCSSATMDWMDQEQERGVVTTGCSASLEAVEQTLGTQFGKATEFATSTVSFERGDLHAMAVLYYDDSKGLRQRGIVLAKPSRKHLSQQPQAFPAMSGCTPPPGWNG